MKIVVVLTLTLVLLFLVVYQHEDLIVSKFAAAMAKSSHLVTFLAFNAIVMVILVGSSKPSSEDLDWFFRLNPPLACHETMDECEGEKEESDEDYDSSDNNNHEFVPAVMYLEYREQKAKDDQYYAHSCDEDGSDTNHASDDGYEEDNDDEGSDINYISSEDEEDELKRRVEEFIDKIYKKWKEELLNDPKLLPIAAA